MEPPSYGPLEFDSVLNLVLDSIASDIDLLAIEPSTDTQDRVLVGSHGNSHTKA